MKIYSFRMQILDEINFVIFIFVVILNNMLNDWFIIFKIFFEFLFGYILLVKCNG